MTLKRKPYVFVFALCVFSLFEKSYELKSVYKLLPQPEGNNSLHSNVNFLVKRNKRQRYGKMKVARVYDDMACIQQCSRLVIDGCIAVNFKKDVIGGLHDCELLAEGNVEDVLAFEDNHDFDHILIEFFKDCAEIMKRRLPSGVYPIRPAADLPATRVMCDMTTDGGGWTVIQNRQDGSVDFYRDWADYKRGFGNKAGEYWLGLDAIHSLTSQRDYQLRVELEDFGGNTRYAEYDAFFVAGEDDNYRLTLGKYSGNAGDSLTSIHNNMAFSTKDRDNDDHMGHCAVKYHGGWWYDACHKANLNGLYLSGPFTGVEKGVSWLNWRGYNYSLKRAVMKIRPKDF